jgi:ribosomal protein L11 methyltransferase
MGTGLWRIALTAPDAVAAEAMATALDAGVAAVSFFETAPGASWRVEAFVTAPPDRAVIVARLALAWLGREGDSPAPQFERVAPDDWVTANQASFPPIPVGPYFIHGSHQRNKVPAGRIGIEIDAATAFGTGEHATTRGCLLALGALARHRRRRRILDMGTGTGILAIAAAKTWRYPVLARDIDPEAVRVARHNTARNGVAGLVRVGRSTGYRDRRLVRSAPFDLVLANILARPLTVMAPALAGALAPGGIAVLSGLLSRQAPGVLVAHRLQRLRLVGRVVIGDWYTLVLRQGRSDPTRFGFLSPDCELS